MEASFARRVRLPWDAIVPAVFAAAGAVLGAWLATRISDHWLRALLPGVLAAVLAYTLWRKDLGRMHPPVHHGLTEAGVAAVISLAFGLYDGFFGLAKVINVTTSLALRHGSGMVPSVFIGVVSLRPLETK